MKIKLSFAAILGAAFLAVALLGCSTTNPVVSYLFDVTTNTVATVKHVTNTVERVQAETNALTGAVLIQPIREVVIVAQTNLTGTIDVKPSAALQSWAGLAGVVGDTIAPGAGKGVLAALLGGAGIFAFNTRRKLNAARETASEYSNDSQTNYAIAENFAQSIETIRNVIKGVPQLAPLDAKIVDMLHKNQVSVGLIREAATIVRETVDKDAAKSAAQKLLDMLPKEPA